MRHGGTAGKPCQKDARRIDLRPLAHVVNYRLDERDVIHLLHLRATTAGALVESTAERAWAHSDEPPQLHIFVKVS